MKNAGTRPAQQPPSVAGAFKRLVPSLTQFLELLLGVGKMDVARLEDFRRGGQERLFGGNAIDPTLFRELFVVGKAETQEELDGFVGGGSLGFVLGFRFALCFGFSDFAVTGSAAGAPSLARSNLKSSFLSRRKACFQVSSLWRASWAFSSSLPKSNCM